MQLKVNRLREVLELLGPVVPKRPTMKVLSNVLIADGRAVANNLETTVAIDFPEAQEGYILPYTPILALLKRIPGYDTLSIESSGKTVELTWPGGKAAYETETQETSEYPPFPKVDAEAEGTVDGETLVPALVSAALYCATETTRPVLNGVTVELGETTVTAAGDGFRMAYQTYPIAFPSQATVIIPSRSVDIMEDLWRKTPRIAQPSSSLIGALTARRQMDLAVNKIRLQACFGPVRMVVQLIQGTSPNFRQLIPEDPPIKVKMLAPEFERAVQRVLEVAADGSGIVRLVWSGWTMVVSAGSDVSKAETAVPVTIEGDNGRVAVNTRYLLAYLRGKEGMVTMGLSHGTGPVMFRHGSSPLVLVMPMNVQWKDEAKKEAIAEGAEAEAVAEAEEITGQVEEGDPVEEAEETE